MQHWLERAATELNIRIVVGYVVNLSSGISLPTQALFPDLGGALGMLILDSADKFDASTRNVILSQGFSLSVFSKPLPNEEYDIRNYAEMFAEWGWTSKDRQMPTWMDSTKINSLREPFEVSTIK